MPLPSDWSGFLACPENKSDLACFLSNELILQAPDTKAIVVSGGFSDELVVKSSCQLIDTNSLSARHEEADTRLILHCINAKTDTIVVKARDVDVLVLLLAHLQKIACKT